MHMCTRFFHVDVVFIQHRFLFQLVIIDVSIITFYVPICEISDLIHR